MRLVTMLPQCRMASTGSVTTSGALASTGSANAPLALAELVEAKPVEAMRRTPRLFCANKSLRLRVKRGCTGREFTLMPSAAANYC